MDEDAQHNDPQVLLAETERPPRPNLVSKASEHTEMPEAVPPLNSRQARLASQLPGLRTQVEEVESKLDTVLRQLATSSASAASSATLKLSPNAKEAVLKEAQARADKHVALLTRYNQLKDISMRLLTIIAESEGKRLRDVMDERAIEDD